MILVGVLFISIVTAATGQASDYKKMSVRVSKYKQQETFQVGGNQVEEKGSQSINWGRQIQTTEKYSTGALISQKSNLPSI